MASQSLVGARRRWAVSEGSLSPTVTGNLVTEWSRRGGEGRGDWERVDKGGGGGSGRFARVKEGMCRCDLEGGGVSRGEEYCGRNTNGLSK